MASEQRVYIEFRVDEELGLPDDLFHVTGFEGIEEISQPFRFEVDLLSDDPNIDMQSLVGQRANLKIFRDENERTIFGVIAELTQGEETQFDHYSYSIVLVPRLWLKSLSRQNQIYQELNVPDIVKQELVNGEGLDALLEDDFEFRLSGSYPAKEYLVQYKETDLNFLSRILEHEGIYYYFDHSQGRDRIVFCDDKSQLDSVADENRLPYVPESGLAAFQDEAIHSFRLKQTQISKHLILKDFNYRKPHLPLQGEAETCDTAVGRLCDYGDHFKDPAQADYLAQIRAQMQLCGQQLAIGRSDALLLNAGGLFEQLDHYSKRFNGEYLITRVTHTAGQSAPGVAALNQQGEAIAYLNEFEALPAAYEYRPPLLAVKPKLYGIMSAIVDGASDSDRAQIDDQGRYKLIMPFDISGTGEGKASRWVRKAESYGGQGTGMHFPLLKGTEVIWTCVDGDLDRPIITGVVPNPQNKSVVTSKNSTSNKIVTPSGIQIEMNDGPGSSGGGEQGQTEQHQAHILAGTQPHLVNQRHFAPRPHSADAHRLLTEQHQAADSRVSDAEQAARDARDAADEARRLHAEAENAAEQAEQTFESLRDSGAPQAEVMEARADMYAKKQKAQEMQKAYQEAENTALQKEAYSNSLKAEAAQKTADEAKAEAEEAKAAAEEPGDLEQGGAMIADSANDADGNADKWMWLAVDAYDGDPGTSQKDSYIRMGKVATNAYETKFDKLHDGILVATDGVYSQASKSSTLLSSFGSKYTTAIDASASAAMGYKAEFSAALTSAIKVGAGIEGSIGLGAKLGYDASVSLTTNWKYDRTSESFLGLPARELKEVQGDYTQRGQSIVLVVNKPNPASAAASASSFIQDSMSNTGLLAGSIGTFAATVGGLIAAGANSKTAADACLTASGISTIATLVAAVKEAKKGFAQADADESALEETESKLAIDDKVLLLKFGDNSIALSEDGIAINCNKFIIGGNAGATRITVPATQNGNPAAGVKIDPLIPDEVIINSNKETTCKTTGDIDLIAEKSMQQDSSTGLLGDRGTDKGAEIKLTAADGKMKLDSEKDAELKSKTKVTVDGADDTMVIDKTKATFAKDVKVTGGFDANNGAIKTP